MKKRTAKFGAHNEKHAKRKNIVANFREDETPTDFPDTRSYAENEESFIFQKYSQSYDGRNRYFQEWTESLYLDSLRK